MNAPELIAALKDRLHEKHRIVTLPTSSPDDFGRLIKEVRTTMRAENACAEEDLPLYGDHFNSGLSVIEEGDYVALLGFDDHGFLVTTNTARRYSCFDKDGMFPNVRWLMQSRRLWFDKPELVAPSMRCEVEGLDFRLDMRFARILHVGTAWVHPRLRHQGVGRTVLALHRVAAFERLSAELMFGTTKATTNGAWTGSASHDGLATVTGADGSIEKQQIRIYAPVDARAIGVRALAT